MQDKEALIIQVEEKYMKPLFGFAMNKTYCYEEAEELAAEITYQLIETIYRVDEIHNLEAFIWGVARNTYKKWVSKQKRQQGQGGLEDATEQEEGINPIKILEEKYEENQEVQRLRRELSLLSKDYREVLVAHYMHNSSCKNIAESLSMSESMVKFYLSKGREKIKEGLTMERVYGERSYNPGEFSTYLVGEWNGNKDLWELTSRKIINNILLAAYNQPMTLTELSIETGVPTVYLEDELEDLLEDELMREVSKGKYQTNIFIVDAKKIKQIKYIIGENIREVGEGIIEGYNKVEEFLKKINVFDGEVEEVHYRTFYFQKILIRILLEMYESFDYIPSERYNLHNGYITGCEDTFVSCIGISPVEGEMYKGVMCDMIDKEVQKLSLKKGELTRLIQRQLDEGRIKDLIAIKQGKGQMIEKDRLLYLLEYGYVSNEESQLNVNIPILTEDLEEQINKRLKDVIDKMNLHIHKTSKSVMKNMGRQTPRYLRENLYGYVWLVSAAYTFNQYFEYLSDAEFIDFKEMKDKVITSYFVLKNKGEMHNE